MEIVAVVGSKKGGKTTVVCKLVEQLKASGEKVATVKLLERAVGIDVNGKETDLHGMQEPTSRLRPVRPGQQSCSGCRMERTCNSCSRMSPVTFTL